MHLAGVVVALLGKATGAGSFLVQDFLEAGLPPQIEKLPKLSNPIILILHHQTYFLKESLSRFSILFIWMEHCHFSVALIPLIENWVLALNL